MNYLKKFKKCVKIILFTESSLFDEFDETRRLSLDELHKRAYESIDKFDNFNYDYEDPPPKKKEINANLMLKLKSIKSRY